MNSNLSGNEVFPSSCGFYVVMGGKLHQPSTLTQTFLIIIIVVHILTFPVTAALNVLVMIAVKMKPRLRSHKSNIGLALLASTDFVVGILVQPSLIAMIITVLLDDISSATCVLQGLTRAMSVISVSTSLIHMALISGERYVAMRHPFAHFNLVTEVRLLVASALANDVIERFFQSYYIRCQTESIAWRLLSLFVKLGTLPGNVFFEVLRCQVTSFQLITGRLQVNLFEVNYKFTYGSVALHVSLGKIY